MSAEEASFFEQRLMWMRVHLVVGWAGENADGDGSFGRLAVLGMMA